MKSRKRCHFGRERKGRRVIREVGKVIVSRDFGVQLQGFYYCPHFTRKLGWLPRPLGGQAGKVDDGQGVSNVPQLSTLDTMELDSADGAMCSARLRFCNSPSRS